MANNKFRIGLVRFGRTASLQIASVARHTSRFAPSIASQTRRPNAEFTVDHILTMNFLQDQSVLILGLGASGLSMARWCVRCGAQVTVADTRSTPPQLAALQQDVPTARFIHGALDAALIDGTPYHAIFKSPGLSPSQIAIVLEAANVSGIRVRGELCLFFEALVQLKADRGYAPIVLAITGTNGKTTVTSLTGQLVACAGKTVAVAGNIGPALLDTLSEHQDKDTLPEVWVLELSSFQLEGETSFDPTAATVLNITEDHLDWHGSMQAYAKAKSCIFGANTVMVVNREDPTVMAMLQPPVHVKCDVSFGGDSPPRVGDFGLEVVNGVTWLVVAQDASAPYVQRLMPADALRIRGRHNAINALSALALGSAAGCALAPMLCALRDYGGEPHRVQPIGTIGEVEFFDDSKGTNVGATVAALNGLGVDRKVVVILGGDGKGQNFSPLASPVSRYARAVVLIGRDAPLIRTALADTGVALHNAVTLPDAVAQALSLAQASDAVLLSPACASFDMFDNYEHRARVFVQAFTERADAAGITGGEL